MKTGKKIFLMGDMVDEHKCDNCEEVCNEVGFYYWGNRDFTMCISCLKNLSYGERKSEKKKAYQKKTIPDDLRWKIFNRDTFTCQYCGSTHNLTVDHVTPEVRGGPMEWFNLVTACKDCNTKKRDRTPEEAGMQLRRAPIRFE